MTYEDWERDVAEQIKRDSLWKMTAYRLALFVSDIGWQDTTKLVRDRRTRSLSDQLHRSLGSISADPAEGYSRGTGRARARLYEYAQRGRVLRDPAEAYHTDPATQETELLDLSRTIPMPDSIDA